MSELTSPAPATTPAPAPAEEAGDQPHRPEVLAVLAENPVQVDVSDGSILAMGLALVTFPCRMFWIRPTLPTTARKFRRPSSGATPDLTIF